MPNKPAYPIIWLACIQIDVIPAFINFNLVGDGLAHCISVAGAKLVLFDDDLAANVRDVAQAIREKQPETRFARWRDEFNVGEKGGAAVPGELVVDAAVLRQMSGDRIPDERRKGITWQSPLCFIYTSGTSVGNHVYGLS